MRKDWKIFIFFLMSSIFLLSSPFSLKAQKPTIDIKREKLRAIDCCRLKHTFKVGGTTYSKAVVVISPEESFCPLKGFRKSTPHWAGICTLDGIATVADWIFWITMIAVGIALVFAGLMFIGAGGNPKLVERAKKIFFYSLIGILGAVLAQFIPAIARYFIGV